MGLTGSNQPVFGPAGWSAVFVVKDSGKKTQLRVWRHFPFWLAAKPNRLPSARTLGFFISNVTQLVINDYHARSSARISLQTRLYHGTCAASQD
jgi:hypothetical protein